MEKIFIITSERSGSNLLRTLLNNHSQISAPIAPHFLNSFDSFIDKYGNLNNESNIKQLLKDMTLLANHKFNQWNLTSSSDQLYELYKPTTSTQALDSMYSQKALSDKKSHYACKDNDLYKFALEIKLQIPNAKFIYLYRDVRDHVASWMKTPLFLHTPFDAAQKWSVEQKKILRLIKSRGVVMHRISYEELIQNPTSTMKNLFEYLKINYEKSSTSTDSANSESKRNPLWKNLSKPVISDNFNKYRKTLTPKDIRIVESIAKHEMMELGYTLDTKADWNWTPRITGIEMRLKRRLSKIKNRNFFKEKMVDLLEKQKLISRINNSYSDDSSK